MRIIHSCLRYPPATGGVETYVREIVERTRIIDANRLAGHSLRQRRSDGRDVRVLTSKLRTHHPPQELDPNLLLNDPPYIQRLHHISTPGIAYPRLQALSYYIGHHKPDIIHGYSYWYHPADAAARHAKKNNIPFIFHPIFYTNKIRQKPLWRLYSQTVGRKTFAAADVTVVISPFEQQLIEKEGLPVKRFELIPPGIDISRFEENLENPFVKKGISGNILLSVSRVAPGKGLEDLVSSLPEIIKQDPSTSLVIVGEDFGATKDLKNQAAQSGVENKVHFWGKISDKDLIAAYQYADIFIHPSYYEAFGIVIAESLTAGTPVIARNTAAIPYVCPHEKTGLLFNNQKELARHVISLLNNPSLRDSYSAAGKKHVREKFTWEKSIKKLADLYSELYQPAIRA